MVRLFGQDFRIKFHIQDTFIGCIPGTPSELLSMVDEFIIYNQRVYACSHLSNL